MRTRRAHSLDMKTTTKYIGKALRGFDHEYRPTREGRCEICNRSQRNTSHGYEKGGKV